MIYRDRSIATNDDAGASRWTAHILAYFTLIGKAVNELRAFTVNNVTNNFIGSADYWALQRVILEALVNHPAARAEVLRALESIGDDASPPQSQSPRMIDVTPSVEAA